MEKKLPQSMFVHILSLRQNLVLFNKKYLLYSMTFFFGKSKNVEILIFVKSQKTYKLIPSKNYFLTRFKTKHQE